MSPAFDNPSEKVHVLTKLELLTKYIPLATKKVNRPPHSTGNVKATTERCRTLYGPTLLSEVYNVAGEVPGRHPNENGETAH